jgi:hypothetical protein
MDDRGRRSGQEIAVELAHLRGRRLALKELGLDRAPVVGGAQLGSLFSSRLLRDVLGLPLHVDDESLVNTWVQVMTAAIITTPPD